MKKKTGKTKVLYQGRYLKLMVKDSWEFVERVSAADVVAMIAVTPQNKLVLVEQLRVPVGRRVMELPAGLVADSRSCAGESLVSAARRELWEETGYEAKRWKIWLESPLNPAISRHHLTFFRAYDLKKTGPGGGNKAENEDIRVHEMPVKKGHNWLKAKQKKGIYIDLKIYTALFLLEELKNS